MDILLICKFEGGEGGVKDWRMKADFLLAVLAQLCISCPTTADWDGWLSWTINTVGPNWCHIALDLSPEEKAAIRLFGFDPRAQNWVDGGTRGESGLEVFMLLIQLLGATLWRFMDAARSLGKVRTSVTLTCSYSSVHLTTPQTWPVNMFGPAQRCQTMLL